MDSSEERAEYDRVEGEFRRGLLPKLRESNVYVGICPEIPDWKFCLELGAAIMLGKPLIVVVPQDRKLPAKLAEIADRVVRLDPESPGAAASEIGHAIQDVICEGRR